MSASHLPKRTGASFASAILSAPKMRINPDAFIEPGYSRRTSRKRDNGLFDPYRPVLLHEDIVDGDVATAEVLMEFGFALCDADADTWFHPYSQFQCRSQGEECCRWKRTTILRCSVTTDITRKDDTLGWVTDLEPLGSLHHPPCINQDCRLNLKPGHIMRLEKRQLVSRILSDPEKDALLSRKRDKWFGQFQDEYPLPVGIMPFSRDPNEEPIRKKRELRRYPSATNSLAAHGNRQSSDTTEAGPSRPRFDPVTEYIGNQAHAGRSPAANPLAEDGVQTRDIKPSLEPEHHRPQSEIPPHHDTPPAADNESNLELNGHPGITRITDHYLIPGRQLDRMQREKSALRARVAELEQQADQEVKAALKKKIAELMKEKDGYKEEAEKAKKQVQELKSKVLQLFG